MLNQLLIAAALQLGQTAQAPPKPIVYGTSTLYSDSYALIVSVDEGRDGIAVTYNDGEKVRDHLVNKFQYNAPNVKWLHGPDANETKMADWFKSARKFDPEACVFIYLSMHAKEDGSFLLYNDGERHELGMQKVAEWLKQIPSKHVVLIADCCYSGLLFDQFKSTFDPLKEGEAETLASGKCHYVVASSGADKTSVYGLGGSRFTTNIAFALEDAAARSGPSKFAEVVNSVLNVSGVKESKPRIARFVVSSDEEGEFLLVPKAGQVTKQQESAQKVMADLLNGFAEGRRVGIREGIEQALRLDPSFAVRRDATSLYFQNGDLSDALKLAKELVAEQPNDERSVLLLTCTFIAQNEPKQAAAAAETFVQRNPKSVPGHAILATAYAVQGKIDEAVRATEAAVNLDPTLADLRISLIDNMLVTGRGQDVTPQIREMIRYCGWNGDIWTVLASHLSMAGRSSLLLPFVRGNATSDGTALVDSLLEATSLIASGKYDEVTQIPMPASGTRRRRATLAQYYGISWFAQGKYEKMHTEFDRAIAILREPASSEESNNPNTVWKGSVPDEVIEEAGRLHLFDPKNGTAPDYEDVHSLLDDIIEPFDPSGDRKDIWLSGNTDSLRLLVDQLEFTLGIAYGEKLLDEHWDEGFPGSLAKLLEETIEEDDTSTNGDIQSILLVPYVKSARDASLKELIRVLNAGEAPSNLLDGKPPLFQQTLGFMARGLGVIGVMPRIAKRLPAKEKKALRELLLQQCQLRPDDLKLHVSCAKMCQRDKDPAFPRLKTVMLARWPWLEGAPMGF